MKKLAFLSVISAAIVLSGCSSNQITEDELISQMVPMSKSSPSSIQKVDVDTFCEPVVKDYKDYSIMTVERAKLSEKREKEGIDEQDAYDSIVKQQDIVQRLENHTSGYEVTDETVESLRKEFSIASSALIESYNTVQKTRDIDPLNNALREWERKATPLVMKCMEEN